LWNQYEAVNASSSIPVNLAVNEEGHMKSGQWTTYLIDAATGLSCLVIAGVLFILIGVRGNLSTIHINIGHPLLILLGCLTPFFLAGLLRANALGIRS
jgi:hypothetical protein